MGAEVRVEHAYPAAMDFLRRHCAETVAVLPRRQPPVVDRSHVELAYAQTSHANQGRTVDTSLVFIDAPVGTAGVYVPMTRGRATNEAFVVTDGQQSAIEVRGRRWPGSGSTSRPSCDGITSSPPAARSPRGVQLCLGRHSRSRHRHRCRTRRCDRPPCGTCSRPTTSSPTPSPGSASMSTRQSEAWWPRRDSGSVGSTMKAAAQRIEWANQRLSSYDRPFKRRRHRFDISSDHSIIEAARAGIDRGRADLAALEAKSRRLERELAHAGGQLSTVPELERDQHRVRARLRSDLEIRADELSMDSLVVLPRHLGHRPENGIEAAAWDRAAARIEQHRVAFGVTDDREPLGPAPGVFEDADAASRRAAQEATHALEATLWRDHGIERQGPELSL